MTMRSGRCCPPVDSPCPTGPRCCCARADGGVHPSPGRVGDAAARRNRNPGPTPRCLPARAASVRLRQKDPQHCQDQHHQRCCRAGPMGPARPGPDAGTTRPRSPPRVSTTSSIAIPGYGCWSTPLPSLRRNHKRQVIAPTPKSRKHTEILTTAIDIRAGTHTALFWTHSGRTRHRRA